MNIIDSATLRRNVAHDLIKNDSTPATILQAVFDGNVNQFQNDDTCLNAILNDLKMKMVDRIIEQVLLPFDDAALDQFLHDQADTSAFYATPIQIKVKEAFNRCSWTEFAESNRAALSVELLPKLLENISF